ELALHLLGERGPVATHDLHADELDRVEIRAVSQSRGTLARATSAVAGARQEQLQVQLLELQLELALHAPALFDVRAQLLRERSCQFRSARSCAVRIVRTRVHEQAVRVAVEHHEARSL